MSTLIRKIITIASATAVGATLSVAAVSASQASSRHSSPHSVPMCAGSNVDVWINTSGSGAAGSVYYSLRFTNLGTASCWLRGYPGVSAVTLGGAQQGSPASRNSAVVTTVLLGRGKTARANLQVPNTSAVSPSSCHAVLAAGLRVYAPGSTIGRFVPFPLTVCSVAHQIPLRVYPVTS